MSCHVCYILIGYVPDVVSVYGNTVCLFGVAYSHTVFQTLPVLFLFHLFKYSPCTPKNHALVAPRSGTPPEKGLNSYGIFPSDWAINKLIDLTGFKKCDILKLVVMDICIPVYPLGTGRDNSPRMSCGYIVDVVGFSSKKPIPSFYQTHITIRGIIALHDFTPLCKVLVAARALFFLIN